MVNMSEKKFMYVLIYVLYSVHEIFYIQNYIKKII